MPINSLQNSTRNAYSFAYSVFLLAYLRAHRVEIDVRAKMGNGPAIRLARRVNEAKVNFDPTTREKLLDAVYAYRACTEN